MLLSLYPDCSVLFGKSVLLLKHCVLYLAFIYFKNMALRNTEF